MKALLLENIHNDAVSRLTEAGFEVEHLSGSISEDDLATALTGVELLGIRSNTRVSAKTLQAARSLRAIGCFCIGTNNVELDAATQQGIAVFNAPYSNSRSVVELVMAEIVVLARRLHEKTSRMHAGIWDKSAQGSHEVRGRTLGIIGYGNIGTQLANLAEAFGMRVIYYDLADRPSHGNAQRMASLPELLANADVVSIHVDGRPGNAGLFGRSEFELMKPRALFINASRGLVVDENALRESLESGHLAGAALDVFPAEPKRQGDPFVSALQGLENVILTPHIAAATAEAQQEIGNFVSQKLLGYHDRGATGLSVNLPNVELAPSGHTRLSVLLRGGIDLQELDDQSGIGGLGITGRGSAERSGWNYVLTDLERTPSAAQLVDLANAEGVTVTHVRDHRSESA